jgi:DNA-binding transcriptional LysR family regulator
MVMQFHLRDLEYFAQIARHGHIGRAADALGLTQPALSKSLQRLEAASKARLVERVPHGVELTAMGARLLTHVQRLRVSMQDITREIADLSAGQVGRLSIGAGPDTAEDLLPVACAKLHAVAPKVDLTVKIDTFDMLLPALRNGELELVVSGFPDAPLAGITNEQLYEHEFGVFVSARHRLARRRRVTLHELAAERWVLAAPDVNSSRSLRAVFSAHKLPPPSVAVEIASARLRLGIVEQTNLVGFFWKQLVRQAATAIRLTEIPVREIGWRRPVHVSYRDDAYLSPVAARMADILRATAHAIQPKARSSRSAD